MKKLFYSILLCALPYSSYAGWVGAGGGFIRDSANPWFLKNTKVIQYCIKIDEINFGLSRSIAEQRIATAIEYWKKEFEISRNVYRVEDLAGIATQNFILTECSSNTDIQFLLGVLPEKDIPSDWIPTSYVGVAIRTDYDRINMKGRGFIYISPGNGPLKYNSSDIVSNAWSLADGHTLRVIVMHELGHIFGISHNSGSGINLMHQSFPESVLQKVNWVKTSSNWSMVDFIKNYNPPTFKRRTEVYSSAFMSCVGTPSIKAKQNQIYNLNSYSHWTANDQISSIEFNSSFIGFFEITRNEGSTCSTFKINNNKLIAEVKHDNKEWEIVGAADLTWDNLFRITDSLVLVWLPPEQKVISTQRYSAQLLYTGDRELSTKFKGTYVSTDGKVKREVFGQINLETGVTLGGIGNDGKTYLSIY